jgi:mono/diheme cytochrome c family protein
VLLLAAAAGACQGKAVNPDDGRRLFALTCARCHGAEGKGGVPAAPGQPPPRDLTDPIFQSARTDDEIRYTIGHGKGTAMPAFAAAFSPREIDALVAYLRTLRR